MRGGHTRVRRPKETLPRYEGLPIARGVFQIMMDVAGGGARVPVGTGFQAVEQGMVWTAEHCLGPIKEDEAIYVRSYDDIMHEGFTDHRAHRLKMDEQTTRRDMAVLGVEWNENVVLRFSRPPHIADGLRLGTPVVIAGFPIVNKGRDRLRAVTTTVQCTYTECEVTYHEMPYPAINGMSGSPVFYAEDDMPGEVAMSHVVAMVRDGVEGKMLPAEAQEDTREAYFHWTRAVVCPDQVTRR